MKSEVLDLPSISVIVATYNRADYLQICLACLGAQDYEGRWQIIVADDGSTDHTADVFADARRNALCRIFTLSGRSIRYFVKPGFLTKRV